MRRVLIINICVIILASCEPAYLCKIVNDTQSDVILITKPSILDFAYSSHRDSLAILNRSNDDDFFICNLAPQKTIIFFGDIGRIPVENRFPYIYIELVVERDTLRFTGKEIIKSLWAEKSTFYTTEYTFLISKVLE